MTPDASRTWFLTWTTYATWLPGDRRGFVGPVREITSNLKITRNEYGVPYETANLGLEADARDRLHGEPIRLTRPQATIVADQIEATASFRGWTLHAVAVMANHVHLVIAVPGDPDPENLLRDFKSYASRALNAHYENRKTEPGGPAPVRSGNVPTRGRC